MLVITRGQLWAQVQIMACTADEDAVGYLNAIDERFRSARGLNCGAASENRFKTLKIAKKNMVYGTCRSSMYHLSSVIWSSSRWVLKKNLPIRWFSCLELEDFIHGETWKRYVQELWVPIVMWVKHGNTRINHPPVIAINRRYKHV